MVYGFNSESVAEDTPVDRPFPGPLLIDAQEQAHRREIEQNAGLRAGLSVAPALGTAPGLQGHGQWIIFAQY